MYLNEIVNKGNQWNLVIFSFRPQKRIPYSNGLNFVVIITAGFCKIKKNRTNFGLHINFREEALFQQDKQCCLAGLPHLERLGDNTLTHEITHESVHEIKYTFVISMFS